MGDLYPGGRGTSMINDGQVPTKSLQTPTGLGMIVPKVYQVSQFWFIFSAFRFFVFQTLLPE